MKNFKIKLLITILLCFITTNLSAEDEVSKIQQEEQLKKELKDIYNIEEKKYYLFDKNAICSNSYEEASTINCILINIKNIVLKDISKLSVSIQEYDDLTGETHTLSDDDKLKVLDLISSADTLYINKIGLAYNKDKVFYISAIPMNHAEGKSLLTSIVIDIKQVNENLYQIVSVSALWF